MSSSWSRIDLDVVRAKACWVAALLLTLLVNMPGPTQAQGTDPIWCVIQRSGMLAGQPIKEHAVVRCADAAGAGMGWMVIDSNMTFADASARRDSLNAAAMPTVWCVIRRDTMMAGKMVPEHSVVRCDNAAGAGPGWTVLQSNMTFAAASAMRDSLNATNTPAIWCLIRRNVMLAGTTVVEHSVVRCDNLAGAGAGWTVVQSDMTFTAASASRDSLNAANAPGVWCLIRRQEPTSTGGSVTRFSVVRCDQLAGAGAGWMVVQSNMTFTAASAARDSLNAASASPTAPTPPAIGKSTFSFRGTWSGTCKGMSQGLNGTFQMAAANGAITGSFTGPYGGGPFAGRVDDSGSLAAGGGSGVGLNIQWRGTVSHQAGKWSGAGSWSGSGGGDQCGGGWRSG
jgi:uncharacterized protein YmfQ (DUF2313 family)